MVGVTEAEKTYNIFLGQGFKGNIITREHPKYVHCVLLLYLMNVNLWSRNDRHCFHRKDLVQKKLEYVKKIDHAPSSDLSLT